MPRLRRSVEQRLSSVVAAVIALATLASCTASSRPPETQQVPVSPDRTATLTLNGGPTVAVAAHAVRGTGTLSGETVDPPAALPTGTTFSGHVWQLEVSGTTLTGSVTLHFPAPATTTSPEPAAAFLAYWDTIAKAWTPVPTTFDAATNTLAAESNHLSIWTSVRFDTAAAVKAIGGGLNSLIGRGEHGANPSCDDESRSDAAHITVSSSSGNAVKWCRGVKDGAPELKVLNNHGFAVAMSYPSTWRVTPAENSDGVVNAAIDVVAKFAEQPPAGTKVEIVPAGETVSFTAPPGGSGTVAVTPSSEAYLLSALVFGADTLAMTWGDLPWFGTHADPSKTAKAVQAIAASKDCIDRMSALAQTDVSDAKAVGTVFREAAGLAVGCLGDQWKEAYGVTAWWSSAALGIVFWLVDGVKLALAGLGAAVDTGLYFDGYRIQVRQTLPMPPVATDSSFGPVILGMTLSQLESATGAQPLPANNPHCTDLAFTVDGSSTAAYAEIFNDLGEPALPMQAYGVVANISTPAGTKTDRGVGDGSTIDAVRAAYSDRNVALQQTQAGEALVVTTGDPNDAGVGNPGALIGFAVNEDGLTVGSPFIGGVPGYEYCSG